MPLEQARQKFARRLSLGVDSSALNAGFSQQLEGILKPYQVAINGAVRSQLAATGAEFAVVDGGAVAADGCEVMVNFQRDSSRGCIIFGQQWKVSPSEDLLKQLKSLLGKDKIELNFVRPTTLGS